MDCEVMKKLNQVIAILQLSADALHSGDDCSAQLIPANELTLELMGQIQGLLAASPSPCPLLSAA
ncbi:hypothetical protein K6Y31_20600 [Motilimonas cestriensis]|uniref:Uncharacterized protein n=1 Tax=Motilimonas cestriensis TaxID=2742685 RepID=A0ABS8WG60_9GAMM|nr:hypothetical protein [Motilimonas cestriensis]MCE2597177.1 hypothetical protein [Motilimonas cestriensis]